MSDRHIPKCLSQTATGRWSLRAQLRTGSSKSIVRTFDTLHEALAAHHSSETARALGQCVIAAVDDYEAPRAMTAPLTPAPFDRSLTMDVIIDEFLAERQRIHDASDHTLRRSLRHGRNSLRPSTLKADYREARNHFKPRFGGMHPRDITRAEVERWMAELAERGIGVHFAGALLIQLRVYVGRAPLHARPDDFPWSRCAPIPPAKPNKPANDPSKWGGLPGSAPPVVTFSAGCELAELLSGADRLVLYSEHFGGPRVGETFGLTLGDFFYRSGRLWVRIDGQCLENNQRVNWVKTDAAYRDIPLPGILTEYIEAYVERYHDADLRNLTDEDRARPLIVNPAGRGLDGEFLPGVRSNFSSRMTTAKSDTDFAHGVLGYHLSTHSLRKSVSTYLLNARPILRHIINETTAAESTGADGPDAELVALRRQLELERLANPEYEPMHVSKYLGHAHDGDGDRAPASVVTLSHYNLSTTLDLPFEAIADVIDRIGRFEVGSLLDDPDPNDLLPVHPVDDPEWVTVEVAAELVGLEDSNVLENVHRGRLDGHLAWLANGGYLRNRSKDGTRPKPSLPQHVISRTSIEEFNALRQRPSIGEFERALGMSNKAVWANFIDTGKLGVERMGSYLYFDRSEGDALIAEIHDAVLDVIATCGPITETRLHREFNKRHGYLLRQGRATQRWITHWVQTLVDQGRATRRSNRALSTPPSDVVDAAHAQPANCQEWR